MFTLLKCSFGISVNDNLPKRSDNFEIQKQIMSYGMEKMDGTLNFNEIHGYSTFGQFKETPCAAHPHQAVPLPPNSNKDPLWSACVMSADTVCSLVLSALRF